MEEPVHLARADGVATLTLNRPERLNAVDMGLARGLQQRLQDAVIDCEVAAVIITGSGRAFCAGGDLEWAVSHPGGPAAALHMVVAQIHQSLLEIHQTDKPVIAAVNGVAGGGGLSLALGCDFRVLERSAILRQAYTSAGLSIDGGGTFALPRLVGVARSLEIAAFDEPIPAERALDEGLVTRLADEGEALEEAHALAAELIQGSLASFAASKRLLRRSHDAPLETQLEREREAMVACAAGSEGVEGLRAFATKGRPDFPAARAARSHNGRQNKHGVDRGFTE